jgi:hypothetical protein
MYTIVLNVVVTSTTASVRVFRHTCALEEWLRRQNGPWHRIRSEPVSNAIKLFCSITYNFCV